MLEVSNLTKKFGGLTAVNDLSFTLNEGEILSIIGPNGAGKSTCFKLISSFLKPTSGTIKLNGRDITGIGVHNVVDLKIVRTFQETTIFKDMTVRDAVVLGHQKDCRATLFGMVFRSKAARKDNEEAHQNANQVLELLGMTEVADTKAAGLPQGMLRNLGIAIALAAKPNIILLDEPLAGIDPIAVADIRDLAAHLKDHGLGVLITDHNVRETLDIIDRAYILHEGTVMMEGTPADIVAHEGVRRVYLGDAFSL